MEFAVVCPVDGCIDVGIGDVDGVVLKDHSCAEITFICPRCGSAIMVTAVVPAFLFAAIEALAASTDESSDASGLGGVFVVSSERGLQDSVYGSSRFPSSCSRGDVLFGSPSETESSKAASSAAREAINSAYCEYFRRQLASVDSVEDILAQIDTGSQIDTGLD